jgi:hypothetical protein
VDFWDVFWLLLIYIPLVMVWAFALVDIFRRDDVGGGSKAFWLVAVLVLPLVGTLLYLLFRPAGATKEERVLIDRANRDFVAAYTPDNHAEQLRVLADLHDRGKLSDDEYAAEKARLTGSADSVGKPLAV